MARMTPADRRAAIVAATRAVMERRGIAGTTVRDVAAEVGTSSGLIHHYVDSMDDLLAEAFEQAAREDLAATVAAISEHTEPLDQLDAFIHTYDRAESNEHAAGGPASMQLWLDAWAEAARRPALRRISRTLNEEWQRILRDIISHGVRSGSMTTMDADASAWRLLSLLDGLTLQTVAHGNVVSREQADAWAREGAERELGLPPRALRG
jgi:AcrR family transcriptional regulator